MRLCSPDVIDLHVMDTVAAFLAGVRTKEGEALSALYGGRADRAELAAAAAAIARLSECDDIHLPSCVTPGSVVIPVALALGGSRGEDEFNRAVAAGYAAGLGLGIAIGGAKALAGGVWPTLLAAPLMAAVTASCLSGHDQDRLAHAMALALAGTSGRLGRPTGTPSGRWFLLGEAVLKGLRASEAAGQGFRGDLTLLSKPWLTAQAGHDEVDIGAFDSSAPRLNMRCGLQALSDSSSGRKRRGCVSELAIQGPRSPEDWNHRSFRSRHECGAAEPAGSRR